jgi:hypothetical protein
MARRRYQRTLHTLSTTSLETALLTIDCVSGYWPVSRTAASALFVHTLQATKVMAMTVMGGDFGSMHCLTPTAIS